MSTDPSETWPPRIEPAGDRCLLLRLGEQADAATLARVHAVAAQLRSQPPLPGVRDIVPAFASVAVHYRPEALASPRPHERLRELLLARLTAEAPPETETGSVGRVVELPICYGAPDNDFGPDLAHVAQHCGLSPAAVIARHQASPHRVAMLGFAPGFPFISGLDPALTLPRRSSPREQVPPGSVAIARGQTCIYPLATPGGWHLIGRMPLRLFDPLASAPCLLAPGDAIRFRPIALDEYQALLAGASLPP